MNIHKHLSDVPHVVYRAYGRGGVLLYVGCTHDFSKRLSGHRTPLSPWLPFAVEITLESFPNADLARHAEAQAILTEFPAFNDKGAGLANYKRRDLVISAHVASELVA